MEEGKKYITKNGSIVQYNGSIVQYNGYDICQVLRGGHKYGDKGHPHWDGYSPKIESRYVVNKGKYETFPEWGLTKEEEDIVHGLDIVGPVLNTYEVCCMMKKNKKAKFRRINDPFNAEYDYYSLSYKDVGYEVLDFVLNSEWVKV